MFWCMGLIMEQSNVTRLLWGFVRSLGILLRNVERNETFLSSDQYYLLEWVSLTLMQSKWEHASVVAYIRDGICSMPRAGTLCMHKIKFYHASLSLYFRYIGTSQIPKNVSCIRMTPLCNSRLTWAVSRQNLYKIPKHSYTTIHTSPSSFMCH